MSQLGKMPYTHELIMGVFWAGLGMVIWGAFSPTLFRNVAAGSIILMGVGRIVLPPIGWMRSSLRASSEGES